MSETAIARRYYDEIVNSSIFESACLQGTCFMIYKDAFFLDVAQKAIENSFSWYIPFYIFIELYNM